MTKVQENGMNHSTSPPRGAAADGKGASLPAAPALLDSQELLRGQNAVAITHNGALYRLQTTRQGKLILTK
jgi:hemin uptake protein HemP